MFKESKSFVANMENLTQSVKYVEDILKKNIPNEKFISSVLILEEVLVKLIENADDNCDYTITVKGNYKKTDIKITCKGKEVDLSSIVENNNLASVSDYGPEAENTIRDMILKAYSDKLSSKHYKGVNTVSILVNASEKAMIFDVIMFMVLGLFAGFAIRFLPVEISTFISKKIFTTIYTLFLNSIKTVMAPLVFFSIASCVVGISDLKALGRAGAKIFASYMFTTIIAVSFAFGFDCLIQPGAGTPVQLPGGVEINAVSIEPVSILDTFINIVPSNFFGAFVKSDMLQIIFISMVIGIAAGVAGKYTETLKNVLNAGEALFSKIVKYIIATLPVVVFSSMANTVIGIDASSAGALMCWIGTAMITYASMFVVYMIMIAVIGRLNPFTFIRKFMSVVLMGLSTSSSNATMPYSMECCNKRLGISPKLYSFSIPLGATVNMDGASITYMTLALFLARISGVTISGSLLVTLFVSVFLLSVATPGVPGASIACMTLLLSQVGVPLESLSIALGLLPIMTNFQTTCNVTGDATVTTIVARSEKMIDLEKFNSKDN